MNKMKTRKNDFKGVSNPFNKTRVFYSIVAIVMTIGLLANSGSVQAQETGSYPVEILWV